MLLEFSLGKLACEVFSVIIDPSISIRGGEYHHHLFDMTCMTRIHGRVLIRKVYHLDKTGRSIV